MMTAVEADGDWEYDDKDPYYYILICLMWLSGIMSCVGFAFMMGWLPV